MLDPVEAQKLIDLSVNVAALNTQVAALNDAVGALVRHWERNGLPISRDAPALVTQPVQQVAAMVESLSSLVRHWQRAQLAQQPASMRGPMGGPGGMPGPDMGGM